MPGSPLETRETILPDFASSMHWCALSTSCVMHIYELLFLQSDPQLSSHKSHNQQLYRSLLLPLLHEKSCDHDDQVLHLRYTVCQSSTVGNFQSKFIPFDRLPLWIINDRTINGIVFVEN